jgi:hypothetical protein
MLSKKMILGTGSRDRITAAMPVPSKAVACEGVYLRQSRLLKAKTDSAPLWRSVEGGTFRIADDAGSIRTLRRSPRVTVGSSAMIAGDNQMEQAEQPFARFVSYSPNRS